MNDLTLAMTITSGTLRVIAFFISVIAMHDVIRNGLFVPKPVPWSARLLMYAAVCSLGLSAMASMFRVAGEPWAPLFRECTHCCVSGGLIAVSIMVMIARTWKGEKLKLISGDSTQSLASCSSKGGKAFRRGNPKSSPELYLQTGQ